MIHIVHLIQRRFPERSRSITALLAVASLSALALGAGLLLLR